MGLVSHSLKLHRVFSRGVLLVASLLCTGAALAQNMQPTIAMVLPRGEENIERGFKETLRERGLNPKYVMFKAASKPEDHAAVIAQIRAAKPDLIYTWGTPTTLSVAGKAEDMKNGKYITDIPIIFTEVTAPKTSGLVPDLVNHNRNVAGVIHVAPLPVQMGAMKAYRPIKKIAYIDNPKEPNSQIVRKELGEYASKNSIEIVDEVVPLDAAGNPDPKALPDMMQRIGQKKVDFLYIGPITFLASTHRMAVTQLALDNKIPTFCATETIVRIAKCLVGLFSPGINVGRFAGLKAIQVLVDRKPIAQIPSESLQRLSLLINMPTARKLNLYPPLELINVAEVVTKEPPPPPPPAPVAPASGVAAAAPASGAKPASGVAPAAAASGVKPASAIAVKPSTSAVMAKPTAPLKPTASQPASK